ncbi:MAG: ATP-binding cassette domain-containing protein, partial [Clostridia bacterium]|nr:ATP-binding cassette domain-containing protein [Clostridia bacterium]
MEAQTPLIRMRQISKSFYIGLPNELEILHGIDLDVQRGEFLSIVGASGSGKSTLMNLIGVLDRATCGSYLLDGTVVEEAADSALSAIRNKKIGFVFQNFNLIARTNAQKNVELPMMYAGLAPKQRHNRAQELLELVGVADRMDHQPNELSGGQKQRVAI